MAVGLRWMMLLFVILMGSACGGRSPTVETDGITLPDEQFERINGDTLQEYDESLQAIRGSNSLTLASREPGFHVALEDYAHTDVVIEAETEQESIGNNNAFGVMCRASLGVGSEVGIVSTSQLYGYAFMISGDGYFAILRFDGSFDEPVELVPWQTSIRIRQGLSSNRIRVECGDDELAFFVNGFELARVQDDRRIEEGQAGLMIGVLNAANPAMLPTIDPRYLRTETAEDTTFSPTPNATQREAIQQATLAASRARDAAEVRIRFSNMRISRGNLPHD